MDVLRVPLAKRSSAPARPASRKQRSDGVGARTQLLQTALRLFADKGFAKTSTRQIALAAGANVAAISYYFGDKAGLYRAVFTEPMGSAGDDIALYDQPHLSLQQSLNGFFSGFLKPLQLGEPVQLCMRLHLREMLEPTGLWAEEIDNGIKPAHAALVKVLCRHLKLVRADDDVHRLAFSIAGLALQMFICRDVVHAIRPQLLARPAAINEWGGRLQAYAAAMVEAETIRRKPARPPVARAAVLKMAAVGQPGKPVHASC